MKNLDSKAIWLFFFSSILRGIFMFIFFSVWLGFGIIAPLSFHLKSIMVVLVYLLFAIFFFLLYVILCFVFAKLSYKYYKYELTNDSFRKESGIIWKRYVSVPYERIQNVDIYRGVFARLLGLSDLQIQTAGFSAVIGNRSMAGIGAEGRLPGISKETAEILREELIKRAKNSSRQGL